MKGTGHGPAQGRHCSADRRSKRVRSFAQSAGRLAKNDAIDAEMIAWFADTFQEAPGQDHDEEREQLRQMVTARQTVLDLQTALQNKGEHSVSGAVQRMQARLLKKMAAEIAALEAAIEAKVRTTPHFAELAEIIESVPGLAGTTSAGLIAIMAELGQVNDKIAAALLGAAPYDDDSGKGGAVVTSRADGAGYATSSTWRVLELRHGTIPCSRPSIDACWPRESRRRSRSWPACASSSSSSTS